MSYITRVGNLASAPTLRHSENGPYLYARVLVTDRIKRDGTWVDGPLVPYEVRVKGSYATHLSETVEACGNVRLHFSGRYWAEEYHPADAPARIVHKVSADEVSVSLQFTAITETGKTETEPTPALHPADVATSPWDTVAEIRRNLEES